MESTELVPLSNRIVAMSEDAIEKVRALESRMLSMPQLDIPTEHVLHGGMYARTIFIPANSLVTGVLIKVPTILIVHGDVIVYVGAEPHRLSGYNVFAASAHRKQAVLAITDSFITMMLATDAKTVEDAEKHFTDEVMSLGSHRDGVYNRTLITGE